MAAAESTGLTFVDEEEIPITFLRIAHVDSENEQPSDVDSSEDEESTDESGEENDDSNGEEEQNYSNLRWSSEIRAPSIAKLFLLKLNLVYADLNFQLI